MACGMRESSPIFLDVFDKRKANRLVEAADSFPVFSANAEFVAVIADDAGEIVTASALELFSDDAAPGPAPRGHQNHAASSTTKPIKMIADERIFITTKFKKISKN